MHLSVIIGVLALATLYVWVASVLRRRITPGQWGAFGAALATIVVALNGPIDTWADDRLFTAHMAQHLLLSMVMPPLLLLGIPSWMLRPLLRVPALRATARVVTNPLVAFAIYNGFLILMHTPPVFERMVRDEDVHIALHLALMATGTVMWWPVVSPLPELPRLSYPAQMLYLFVLMIPMAAVSAPITLGPEVIYPWYLEGPHPFGMNPLTDQVVGGLLMWIGAGTYLLGVYTVIFFRWARRDDCDEPPVREPFARTSRLQVS